MWSRWRATTRRPDGSKLLYDWHWISLFFNRVNTAMGKNPLYPFTIPQPVAAKLGFVHGVIRDTARTEDN